MEFLIILLIWWIIGIIIWVLGRIYVDEEFLMRDIFESLGYGLIGPINLFLLIYALHKKSEKFREWWNKWWNDWWNDWWNIDLIKYFKNKKNETINNISKIRGKERQ